VMQIYEVCICVSKKSIEVMVMLCRVKTCSKVSRQRVKKLMGIFKLYSLASLGYYAIENKVAWAISERFSHIREYYSTDLDTIMNVISI
jgi:hypothetical protein